MVKVNDGRPLTESDAKWWIDLGSEGRAHARKSLVELANAPKGERGPILAKLMLDTLFGDIAEHRSNSIDSMIADIFGSKAPKLTISLEPGPFDQEALESAFRSMNDVTLAFHDSQMHRAYYSTDAHRSGKFILDWIRIGRAERMEQRLHIMRELRLGNGQGSLPTT